MKGKKLKALVCTLGLALAMSQSAFAAKVVIDPGHGGSDPGAIGVNGLQEKRVNLEISKLLEEELKNRGYDVYLTRTTDRYLSLQQRVDLKEQAGGDLFVSIHANAHNSSSIRGSLVLYYDNRYPQASYPASPAMSALTPENRSLAQSVATALADAAGTQNRGIVPSAVYVVRNGSMPSILVETAFLSNRQDAELLASESFWRNAAKGIADGIEQYLPSDFSDVGRHWAKDSIIRLKEQGLVAGANHRYYPNRPLTRAEFMAMIDRVFTMSYSEQHDAAGGGDEDDASGNESSVTESVYADDGAPNGDGLMPADEWPDSDEPSDADGAAQSGEEPSGTDVSDPSQTVAFADVPESHWAYEVIQQAIRRGIVKGYPDQTFRPNQPITRAEVTALLDRLMNGTEAPPPGEYGTGFVDVSSRLWYAGSVTRMKSIGLLRGIEEGVFAPDRSMTRAEMAVLFDRYLLSKQQVAAAIK